MPARRQGQFARAEVGTQRRAGQNDGVVNFYPDAVIDGLGLDGARELVTQRDRAYFRDRNDLLRQLPQGVLVAVEDVSFGSDYFMATMRVTIGGSQARGTALLARGSTGWPAIVWPQAS